MTICTIHHRSNRYFPIHYSTLYYFIMSLKLLYPQYLLRLLDFLSIFVSLTTPTDHHGAEDLQAVGRKRRSGLFLPTSINIQRVYSEKVVSIDLPTANQIMVGDIPSFRY